LFEVTDGRVRQDGGVVDIRAGLLLDDPEEVDPPDWYVGGKPGERMAKK